MLPSSKSGLNGWTNNVVKKIEVKDFWLNPKEVTWKGQKTEVADYEFFVMLIQDWMNRYQWTKEQALDEFFSMIM